MKRILSIILAICILAALAVVPAAAEEEPDRSEETVTLKMGGTAGMKYKKHTPLHYDCGLNVPGLPSLIEGVITYDADALALRKGLYAYNEDGIDFGLYSELYDVDYSLEDGRIAFRYTLKEGKGFNDLFRLLDISIAEAFWEDQKHITYEDEDDRPTEPPKADRSESSLRGFALFSVAVEPIADSENAIGAQILNVVNTDGIELYKNGEKTLNIQYGYQAMMFPGNGDDFPLGDADRDYEVTILDATRIQRHLAGLIYMNHSFRLVADVDRDGEMSILDATRIQRYLAGLSALDGSAPSAPDKPEPQKPTEPKPTEPNPTEPEPAPVELATPKLNSAKLIENYVALSWDKVSGAKAYRIYIKGGAFKSWTRLMDTDINYADIPNSALESGNKYTFTVRCLDKLDGETVSGFDSKGVSVQFYNMPEMAYAENTDEGMYLEWTESPGAAKYRLFVDDGGWKKVCDTSETAALITGLYEGESYVFTVRGMDSKGNYITAFGSYGIRYTYFTGPSKIEWQNESLLSDYYKEHYYGLIMGQAQTLGFVPVPEDYEGEPSAVIMLSHTACYGDPVRRNDDLYERAQWYMLDFSVALKRNNEKASDCYFEIIIDEVEETGDYGYYMIVYPKD